MATKDDEVFNQALGLSADKRAELANALLLSLEEEPLDEQPVVDAAWDAEIARRADEVLSGKVKTVDAEEMLLKGREELRKKYGV